MANPSEIPYGYCHCGCGQKTNICSKNSSKRGHIKGEPYNYVKGHNSFKNKGDHHQQWKGGIHLNRDGYRFMYTPGHHRAINNRVFEHILVVEKVLNKPLPIRSVVHHVNENSSDNRTNNLVLCQDETYHRLIHQRMRAFKSCGHANWLKCVFCKLYDDPKYLEIKPSSKYYHRECVNRYNMKRHHQRVQKNG